MRTLRPFTATLAIALAALASPTFAQSWTGAYIQGHVGFTMPRDNAAEVIRFDKDLDGTFTDTVLTAAGANAFSPGFCGGAAATALPAAGCSDDEDGVDFGVRGGYDWQSGRFVFGALGEFASVDVVDSVSAFSTTPAFYTFTRELESIFAVRGRAGVGGERVLAYGTGGAVWASLANSFSTSNAVNTFVQSDDDGAWGYQAGGGLEIRVGSKVVVGGEVLVHETAGRGPLHRTGARSGSSH